LHQVTPAAFGPLQHHQSSTLDSRNSPNPLHVFHHRRAAELNKVEPHHSTDTRSRHFSKPFSIMEDGDDPYQVLGVPKDASESDIKKAYRKLALRHHPDKQTTEDGKQQATVLFAKISNAYEILSDPQKKRDYDHPSGGTGGEDFFHHYTTSDHQHHPFHFHDPFEVFNRVFQNEFARHNAAFQNGNGFRDSFFGGSPFSGRSSSLFDDPFFSGGMMGGMGGGDPFFGSGFGMGGGGGSDPFAMMRQSMMNGPMNGTSTSFVQTISSSSGGNLGGGQSVSTSTTTRIVNGRRQTVTETVIQKPDGTIERQVHTDGDAIDGSTANRPMLDQGAPPPRRRLLGPRHRSSSSNNTSSRNISNGDSQRSLPESSSPQRKKMKKRVSTSSSTEGG
jgi:DnaJ homolog subfamily B member 6